MKPPESGGNKNETDSTRLFAASVLVERIFYAGSNRLYLKTAPEV